jgi:glycosyltransferase involved in cell wall biosynthesis
MLKCGMPEEKLAVFPGGVNSSFFLRQPARAAEWRERIIEDSGKYLVVYAGSLAKWKGIDVLIDAADRLSIAQFVIAGGTCNEAAPYKRILHDRNIRNVLFTGSLMQSDLVSLFQAADMLVYPQVSGVSAMRGSPLKSFEYLASGTPIVATLTPNLSHLKKDDLAVGLCPPDDPVAFANHIRYALDKFPRKMGGYSQNIEFARQFIWETRMESILRQAGIS